MICKPDWLIRYKDVINELRLALYEFENGSLDFQFFINRINKSLINCGYGPIKVVVSDFMTGIFGAYAVYIPRRSGSMMYISTELMKRPRPLLGRILMHEVFHHVLYQNPPSLLFKIAPRKIEPFILISIPLITIITLTMIFNDISYSFLPYIIAVSSITLISITAILIKALNEHELVATALVIYLLTNEWVKDWAYYHDENALMSIKWRVSTMPKGVVVAQR